MGVWSESDQAPTRLHLARIENFIRKMVTGRRGKSPAGKKVHDDGACCVSLRGLCSVNRSDVEPLKNQDASTGEAFV